MFRQFHFPTLYPPLSSSHIDHFLLIFWYFSGSLLLSFLIILPGVRGKQRIYTFLYGSFSLITGVLIIMCNYSYEWETGSIITNAPIRVGKNPTVSNRISSLSNSHGPFYQLNLNIGLRGFNISLVELDKDIDAQSSKYNTNNTTKNIHSTSLDYYNEAFRWEWEQGNQLPTSPSASHLSRYYQAALVRGAPLPILYTAQHFTADDEAFRWGRHYRMAGYYSHILLWLAFPCWLLANILIYICIRYAGFFWVSTGISLLSADSIYWILLKWPTLIPPLTIAYPPHGTLLELTFGRAYWITFYIGVLSIIVGMIIVFADAKYYTELMAFFGIDLLQEYEDYFADPLELGLRDPRKTSQTSSNFSPRISSGCQTNETSTCSKNAKSQSISASSQISEFSSTMSTNDKINNINNNIINSNIINNENINNNINTNENIDHVNKNYNVKNDICTIIVVEDEPKLLMARNNIQRNHPLKQTPSPPNRHNLISPTSTLPAIHNLENNSPLLYSATISNKFRNSNKSRTCSSLKHIPPFDSNNEISKQSSGTKISSTTTARLKKTPNQIPVLRKRGTSHSFFYRKKCSEQNLKNYLTTLSSSVTAASTDLYSKMALYPTKSLPTYNNGTNFDIRETFEPYLLCNLSPFEIPNGLADIKKAGSKNGKSSSNKSLYSEFNPYTRLRDRRSGPKHAKNIITLKGDISIQSSYM